MKILRAYKTELDPNNKQRSDMVAHCGATRWVYNWALARKIEAFENREKIPTAFTLAKELRAVRHEVAPWLTQYSSYVIDSNLEFADRAFDNFFRRCKEGKPGKKGFPKFRSRKRGIGNCRFHKTYCVESAQVRLPIIGWVRLKEHGYIPTDGVKFYGATISEKAGRWFVTIQVEEDIADPINNGGVVGVDFGLKTLAVCSDGKEFENPKAYKKQLKKLKRAQHTASRKVLGSANRTKANRRVAKIHAKIASVRNNTLHQISHTLTKTKSVIVIEDLNVKGMVKNHCLAQAIHDVGFAELRRQLVYKGAWRGCDVRLADRWFASSKTCSACGVVNESLTLAVRKWTCYCGVTHDRDLNAAKNLEKLAYLPSSPDDAEKPKAGRRPKKKNTGAASEFQACGEESSGAVVSRETILCEAGTQQLILFE